jgi:predicted nucleic acid-binding protein
LIWSYILDYENNRNPYQERKLRIKKWKGYAIEDAEENSIVIETAKKLNKKGFHKIDSLHIACAIISNCEYFLTTDDHILKRARLLNDIKINDPIGFIKEILS